MAIEFGSDYSTFRPNGTYGLTYQRITGPRVPLEGVGRRWLTSPGDLKWDPTGGFDVAELENNDLSAQARDRIGRRLASEAKQVDFVIDAAVRLVLAGDELTIAGQILLADRTTHTLLLTASQAGIFFSAT